ncbi:PilN domain-containing protein [uncultured Acinetobacter sp.]|uniref:PilN domain-containing protein n=1 Tax=uncultured Acinetobacter sp. TaxID=165433 RepID=UPI0025E32370|nr:PilN domain-containing protein [uncultured Acinetobacter sp.]
MAKINLLPWRDELREQRKKQFIAICIGVAIIGLLSVLLTWFYFDHQLEDQEQANQLITSTNQNLDAQLKTLDGLQERRNAIIERMKLIQGLQGQRPVTVRLVDELVRVTPAQMYLTKFSRVGDKFTIEGRAESPNTVAELLRGLEASEWYRNAFMNSFLAAEENKNKTPTSVIPRVEESYGSFVVTVDLGEIAVSATSDENTANKTGQVPAAGGAK